MSVCLKIGDHLLNGDQVISAVIRYQLLENLAGQVLMDDVITEVPLSKQEVFGALTGLPESELPEDFGGFLTQWCSSREMTLGYFEAVVLRKLRVEKFKQVQFRDQVESEFLRIKSDLDRVEYSRIQVADSLFAQELYFQLRDDGASFAELAQQHSLDRTRTSGGWVGPVAMSTLPMEAATLFRENIPGKVYGPIVIAEQYWLVRLEQFMPARLTESTQAEVIDRIYQQWLRSQVQAAMAGSESIVVDVDPNDVSPAPVDPSSQPQLPTTSDPTPTPTQNQLPAQVLPQKSKVFLEPAN